MFLKISKKFQEILYEQQKKWTILHIFPSEKEKDRSCIMTNFKEDKQPNKLKTLSVESLKQLDHDMKSFSIIHLKDVDDLIKYKRVFEIAKHFSQEVIILVVDVTKYTKKLTKHKQYESEKDFIIESSDLIGCHSDYVILYDTKKTETETEAEMIEHVLKLRQIVDTETKREMDREFPKYF